MKTGMGLNSKIKHCIKTSTIIKLGAGVGGRQMLIDSCIGLNIEEPSLHHWPKIPCFHMDTIQRWYIYTYPRTPLCSNCYNKLELHVKKKIRTKTILAIFWTILCYVHGSFPQTVSGCISFNARMRKTGHRHFMGMNEYALLTLSALLGYTAPEQVQ